MITKLKHIFESEKHQTWLTLCLVIVPVPVELRHPDPNAGVLLGRPAHPIPV